jgi:gliding motility-associated-like protein
MELQFSAVNPPSSVITAVGQTCVNASITFTDASQGNGKIIKKWFWDFGDSEFSTDQNPTHKYAASGNYTVKLMVEGETGCQSEVATQTIKVIALPVVNFSTSLPACESKDITFTDLSTTAEGNIIKWTWDFGDGSTLEEKTSAAPFSHKYVLAGTYNVKLKLVTDKGCESIVFEKSIVINPVPIVNFGIPEICIRDTFAQFTDSSTIADGSVLSYSWDFGNPVSGSLNSSILKNPTHKYTIAGTYQVTLTVTSVSGCVTKIMKSFEVSGAVPKADFLVLNNTQLCSNKEVVFRNTSTVDFGTIGKVEWFFDYGGDLSFKLLDENPFPGKEYRIQYPIFSAPASKQFIVRMLAYSGGVCNDEEIQTITLKSAPEVVFSSIPDVCQEVPPFMLTQASEKNAQAGIGIYSGNGVSASGIFSPAQAGLGKHTIKYVFTANNGCADSLSREILVMPTPVLFAGRDTVILQGDELKLNPIASGNNLTYKWAPSLGLSRDDVIDPVASPLDDVTYVLTVTSDQGCVSVDAIFVKVLKTPEVPNAFTPNADGVNDIWNIKYLESYENASVKVFSRYGTMVYSSAKGYTLPWKGQMNGSDLPMGTYYYVIDTKTKGRKVISGAVTIIR